MSNNLDKEIEIDIFFQSIKAGDLDSIKSMVKKKPCLINLKNEEGFTPFHLSIYYGHLDIIKFFLSFPDLDVNCQFEGGPLHLALNANYPISNWSFTSLASIKFYEIEIVKLLIDDNRIDINAKNENGITALHIAIIDDDLELYDLLINRQDLDLFPDDNNCFTLKKIATQILKAKYLLKYTSRESVQEKFLKDCLKKESA